MNNCAKLVLLVATTALALNGRGAEVASTNSVGGTEPGRSASNLLAAVDTRGVTAVLIATDCLPEAFADHGPVVIPRYWLIRDAAFAQESCATLKRSKVYPEANIMFEGPRPVLFLDHDGEVVCGFIYRPTSRPRNAFTWHAAFKRGTDYYVRGRNGWHSIDTNAAGKLIFQTALEVPEFDRRLYRESPFWRRQ